MAKIFYFDDLAKGRGALLARASLIYEYKDGAKTDRIRGTRYVIVFPASGFQEVLVDFPDERLLITPEELQKLQKTRDVKVELDGFVAFWKMRGKAYRMEAFAKHIQLI